MKFLLPILLAAPAVMGRACKSAPNLLPSRSPITTTAPSFPPSSSLLPTSKTALSSQTLPPRPPLSPLWLPPPPAPAPSRRLDLGGSAKTGSSTFYGGNLAGGNCMFSTYTLPSGIYGTAFSGAVWNNAASCGACIEVTGPSGTIKAMIVDQCPECEEGHLDLFPDAFTAVGGTDGIVQTSYKFVSCGITSPLYLHNKEGTSQHWFSIQVVNANEPVTKLEVSTDGGSTWQETERKDYNFFENSAGFGVDSVDVKITSKTGKTVTVSGVGVEAGAKYDADSNF
ncbi:uncharacterized protein NECHADRAFT_93246 [Fusarium vanettenii 77-13-4]|uniref:Expansin-like EG45 domain-containing protein n=1 Tax=Fusarium vanettenii (strain ATCC MYA-4622 / CBS 123669 / FGSC 9596 / NRRL 45880 / 77-13-4) TaxID=660122 RepID=C7Z0N0_FUSV7|nr:uncharacterized protein NECHADRAFT_93246 [Fusarium vanettenii 77-13-4]EEU42231.1 hypothetical protein NECHADRAFT_93246 [Fusarium vanettenii 77-13-4]